MVIDLSTVLHGMRSLGIFMLNFWAYEAICFALYMIICTPILDRMEDDKSKDRVVNVGGIFCLLAFVLLNVAYACGLFRLIIVP